LNLRQEFDPIERHQAVEPLADLVAAVLAKAQANRNGGRVGVALGQPEARAHRALGRDATPVRVVVATATLALQTQLATKDVPVIIDAVEAITGRRPKAALLKGRSNYVCLHRVRDGVGEDPQPGLIAAGATVVVALSGGIDSALVAVIAAEAFGPENVIGVSLPSAISSPHSQDDARTLAQNLGLRFETIAIADFVAAGETALGPIFAGRPRDVTEENIQARVRGVLMMALSNKFGALLLTTGNKSEVAVGYCTLYGDMCGGLAVISDVFKTQVYALARWINDDARAAHRDERPDDLGPLQDASAPACLEHIHDVAKVAQGVKAERLVPLVQDSERLPRLAGPSCSFPLTS